LGGFVAAGDLRDLQHGLGVQRNRDLVAVDGDRPVEAMTDTGMWAASCSARPVVRLPSVISTIRAGTGPVVPATLARALANLSMVSLQTRWRPGGGAFVQGQPAMACLAAARSVVGGR